MDTPFIVDQSGDLSEPLEGPDAIRVLLKTSSFRCVVLCRSSKIGVHSFEVSRETLKDMALAHFLRHQSFSNFPLAVRGSDPSFHLQLDMTK